MAVLVKSLQTSFYCNFCYFEEKNNQKMYKFQSTLNIVVEMSFSNSLSLDFFGFGKEVHSLIRKANETKRYEVGYLADSPNKPGN